MIDVSSKLSELNKKRGLVVVGYQRGGDDSHAKNDPGDKNKYFSELTHDFQKDLIKWFGLWEYPLATEESKMGNFEKSIIEIEWCEGHGEKFDYKLLYSEHNQKRFLQLLESLEPELLMFTGVKMLEILNEQSMKPHVENILGKAKNEPDYITNKHFKGTKLRVGFQSFDKCEVIALPHPNARGLSDAYIALFKDKIKSLLDTYSEKFKNA
ncbi:hypothetical protein [Helicobacter cetorum]|uniref:Uracil-DNA glycosylase-like domain-containing protein n=1 Tax=Helicobacter cetorum (strain ATCC BAA-429 / MIT 00-7128) TaxID=182217 RepID=I0EP91_HELC0|nr:hypothetical protein [Helicobacter cetorum]AFI04760.1 hypothetical protein HCW_07510 [Helicobacter cetorum MIT 00-7128]